MRLAKAVSRHGLHCNWTVSDAAPQRVPQTLGRECITLRHGLGVTQWVCESSPAFLTHDQRICDLKLKRDGNMAEMDGIVGRDAVSLSPKL